MNEINKQELIKQLHHFTEKAIKIVFELEKEDMEEFEDYSPTSETVKELLANQIILDLLKANNLESKYFFVVNKEDKWQFKDWIINILQLDSIANAMLIDLRLINS